MLGLLWYFLEVPSVGLSGVLRCVVFCVSWVVLDCAMLCCLVLSGNLVLVRPIPTHFKCANLVNNKKSSVVSLCWLIKNLSVVYSQGE